MKSESWWNLRDDASQELQAKAQVNAASTQMALEAQALHDEQLAFEVDRLASKIIEKMPSDLWNDE